MRCNVFLVDWRLETGVPKRRNELSLPFLSLLAVCAPQVSRSYSESLISPPRLGRWHRRGKHNILSAHHRNSTGCGFPHVSVLTIMETSRYSKSTVRR